MVKDADNKVVRSKEEQGGTGEAVEDHRAVNGTDRGQKEQGKVPYG